MGLIRSRSMGSLGLGTLGGSDTVSQNGNGMGGGGTGPSGMVSRGGGINGGGIGGGGGRQSLGGGLHPSTPFINAIDAGIPKGGGALNIRAGDGIFAALSSCDVIWRRAVVAAIITAVFLAVGLLWNAQRVHHIEYAVVIDCGSTGTRVYVYAWRKGKNNSLPRVYEKQNVAVPENDRRAYRRMETEPGLDKFVGNAIGVEQALQPLIDWAMIEVPKSSYSKTPVFLFATAGLRKLPRSDSAWVLSEAQKILHESPFRFTNDWARVISGIDEAVYGWIALNYMMGTMENKDALLTLGALDLGGSSLEVTFVPEKITSDRHSANVTIMSSNYPLYAHSHTGFGLNDAFDKSVTELLQQDDSFISASPDVPRIKHPCLHAGYNKSYPLSKPSLKILERRVAINKSPETGPSMTIERSDTSEFGLLNVQPPKDQRKIVEQADARHLLKRDSVQQADIDADGSVMPKSVRLIGSPNWRKCEALAKAVVHHVPPCKGHCALGTSQPPLHGQFYALTGFFVVYHFFNLQMTDTLDQLLQVGKAFCGRSWKNVDRELHGVKNLERYCFRAPYIVSLLKDGLGLNPDQLTIGTGNLGWTLGAALYEAGAFKKSIKQRHRRSHSLHNLLDRQRHVAAADSDVLPAVTLLGFLALVVVAASLLKWWRRRWRRRSFMSTSHHHLPKAWVSSGKLGTLWGVSSSERDPRLRGYLNVDAERANRAWSSPAEGPNFAQPSMKDVKPIPMTVTLSHTHASRVQSRRSMSKDDLSEFDPGRLSIDRDMDSSLSILVPKF